MIWSRAEAMDEDMIEDSEDHSGLRSAICIAGPTASGKTGFAIEVAKHVDGEIINADALQVYEDLDILSARPSEDEIAAVPHHLFGYVEGDRMYSVGEWVRDAVPVILDVLARQKTPIIVGGTGLYFKALLVGLADVPAISTSMMDDLNSWPVDRLRAEAERLDPKSAMRVLGNDPQRLGRIVGVAMDTGKALSEWQAQTRPIIPDRYVRKAVLMPDRGALYARINARFDQMIEEGALGEARKVATANYPDRAPMLKAIGLSHLLSHLRGEMGIETAIETAKRDTRRLAKRQSTWFRNQCADWPKLVSDADRGAFLETL